MKIFKAIKAYFTSSYLGCKCKCQKVENSVLLTLLQIPKYTYYIIYTHTCMLAYVIKQIQENNFISLNKIINCYLS